MRSGLRSIHYCLMPACLPRRTVRQGMHGVRQAQACMQYVRCESPDSLVVSLVLPLAGQMRKNLGVPAKVVSRPVVVVCMCMGWPRTERKAMHVHLKKGRYTTWKPVRQRFTCTYMLSNTVPVLRANPSRYCVLVYANLYMYQRRLV